MPSKLDFFKSLCSHLNIREQNSQQYKLASYALYDEILELAKTDGLRKSMVKYFEECVLQRQDIKDCKMRLVKIMEDVESLSSVPQQSERHFTPLEEKLKLIFEQLALTGNIPQKLIPDNGGSSSTPTHRATPLYDDPVPSFYSRSISLNKSERRASPRSITSSSRSKQVEQEASASNSSSSMTLSFYDFRRAFKQLYGRREWNSVHERMITEIFYCDGLQMLTCPSVPQVSPSSVRHANQHDPGSSFLSSTDASPIRHDHVTGRESITLDQFRDIFTHLLQLRLDKQNIQTFKDKLLNLINERSMTIHDLFQHLDKEKSGEIDLLRFRDGLKNDLKLFDGMIGIDDNLDSLISDWFASIDIEGSGEITEEYFESNLCEKDIIPLLKRKMRSHSSDLQQLFLQVFNGDLGSCTFKDFKSGCEKIGIRASSNVLKILFNQIDEDGSLTISLDEFIAAIGLNFSPQVQSVKEVILHKLYLMNRSLDEFYEDLDFRKTGITYDQFRTGLQNLLKVYVDDHILRQVFKQMDESGNNIVEFKEFASCINQQAKIKSIKQDILLNAEKRGDSLLDLFSRFDDDKGGGLSMDELKMGLRVYCGVDCPFPLLLEFFSYMDQDGNNSADAEEFEGALNEIRALNAMKAKLDMFKQQILSAVTRHMEKKGSRVESLQTALANLFDRMDVAGRNRLDFYSLRDGIKKHCGLAVEDSMVRLLFEEIDYGSNNLIQMDDFVQSLTELWEMNTLVEGIRMQGSLRKTFDRYFDVDGKGEIDFDRFQKGCSQILTITACRKRVMHMCFNMADTNGSGSISFEEFELVCSRNWESYHTVSHRGIPSSESKKKHKLSKASIYYSDLFRRRDEDNKDDYESYMRTINNRLYDEVCEGDGAQKCEASGHSAPQSDEDCDESNQPSQRQGLDMFFSLEKMMPSIEDRPAILRALERNETYEYDLESRLRSMLASHPAFDQQSKNLQQVAQHLLRGPTHDSVQ